MTLADFKRKAVVGAEMRGGYFWKLGLHGKSIDDCEWRTIEKVQSNGVKLGGKVAYIEGLSDEDARQLLEECYEELNKIEEKA